METGARRFEPETVMISSVPDGPKKKYEGRILIDVAKELREEPVQTLLRLLQSGHGGVQMVQFSLSEDDIRRVMCHPAVGIGSDGWTLHPSAGGKPHPRSYGTFARVLGRYVREEGVLSIEEAVHKMTWFPAQRLREEGLGRIAPGCIADLVVFDPAKISDRATFEEPHRYCDGVYYVVVNGKIVLDCGVDTGVRAGRVLRRGKL